MTDREKVIEELGGVANAIVDGYIHEPGRAIRAISDAIALLKKQEQEIAFLKAMQLQTVKDMNESELGRIVGETLWFRIERR